MICARCQTPNPDQSEVCLGCGASLPSAIDAATIDNLETGSLPSGEDFGPRYQVQSLLGIGGMGKVYKAHDKELDRTVALKIIRQDVAEHPLALQRFKQELQLASRITHPNILRIHDLGECRGLKFVSMQYVEGGDLLQILQREGALPLSRAVPIMVQLCEALQAAQSANVVHRDLKPQNILMGEGDRVFVSDFGLAKSIEASLTGVTRPGAILGTPKYMSPEQVQGKPVDQRTDIYSLGLIFYEILTGTLPFSGDSSYQLMYQRVHELPRGPEQLNPQIPRYLSAIVLRCLERDPSLRYQSATEILNDLRASQASRLGMSQQMSRMLGWEKRRWILAGGVVLALAGLVGLAVYFQRQHARTSGSAASAATGRGITSAPRKGILLLPLHREQDQANLALQAEGILDSLSERLSQLGSLQIATLPADNSVDQQDPARDLARQFGKQFYLTGSLNDVGGKLHAHLSLQDTASGQTTWSKEFSALPEDVFAMEDEIYNQLLAALDVKPTTEELAIGAARPTESVDAYDLYLRGRAAIRNQRSEQTLHSAISLYEEALKKDPNFALAYAGLADSYLDLYIETKDPTVLGKALGASQQAEQLAGNKPEVHFSMGSVYLATGKTAEAVAEFKQALTIAPNSDEGYRCLGSAWRAAGRKDEALTAYQHAVDLNPYYWLNYSKLGNAALAFGENDKALAAYQRVTQLVPNREDGYDNLGIVYFRQGKWAESISAFQKAIAIEPSAYASSNLGTAFLYLRRYSDAINAHREAVKLDPNSQVFAGNLADAYRADGQADAASKEYDRAIELAYKEYRVNPRDADTLSSLSLYYAKKGNTVQALEFIHRARTLQPDDVQLLDVEAIVNALANRPKEALEAVRAALAKGYSAEEFKNEPELRSLQSLPEFQRLLAEADSKK